jgi:phosphate transport system protein
MARKSVSQELKHLVENMLRLGALVEQALQQALTVLQTRDGELARRLLADDDEIDRLRNVIEEQAMHLLTFSQVMAAQDVRLLVAAFSIVRDLERIGDGAAGIARNILQLPFEQGKELSFSQQPLDSAGYISESSIVQELFQLGMEATHIFQETMKALAHLDVANARFLWQEDDVVDVRYHMVRHNLMTAFWGVPALTAIQQDSKMLQRMTYFLWMAHKLERVSDHCSNICERILFIQEGKSTIAVEEPEGV